MDVAASRRQTHRRGKTLACLRRVTVGPVPSRAETVAPHDAGGDKPRPYADQPTPQGI